MSELHEPSDTWFPPMSTVQVESLLGKARDGDVEAMGQLLASAHRYMLAIANRAVSDTILAKVSPLDLVQDTSLEAVRDFKSFKGNRLDEFLAWLRQILRNNIANASRHFEQTQMRQVSREIPLDSAIRAMTAGPGSTPSTHAMRIELELRVELALMKLPDDMRLAIQLRNREHLSFAEIGIQLERSSDAARKLWARAIERLQKELA